LNPCLSALVCCVALALAPGFAAAGGPRSRAVARHFQQQHPCPSTGRTTGACPGYVRDHIVPLACNGPDAVANLQWQTVQAAKAKDKWERRNCVR
jgi:hypothetical protein